MWYGNFINALIPFHRRSLSSLYGGIVAPAGSSPRVDLINRKRDHTRRDVTWHVMP